MLRRAFVRLAILASFAFCLCLNAEPRVTRVSNQRLVAQLRQAKAGEKIVVEGIRFDDRTTGALELQRSTVWADDAKILVHGANNALLRVEPVPDIKYFHGRVAGEAASAAALSLTADGTLDGIVFSGDRRFRIASARPLGKRSVRDIDTPSPEAPVFVQEIDDVDDVSDPQATWSCGVDGKTLLTEKLEIPSTTPKRGTPQSDDGNVAGATYTLRLAFETDDELYAAFGSSAAVTTYIGNLVNATNIIYQRDIGTTLNVGHLSIRSGGAGTDPYTMTTSATYYTLDALLEFSTYWHNNFPQATYNRSAAVMISGKPWFGGIAFSNALCDDDGQFAANAGAPYANKYYGPYAFLGSFNVITTTVPDPTLTVNGLQYGLPANNNFWMLLQFAHEVGHVANGPHTHCVALTQDDKTLYGVTRNFVDECYNDEGEPGCYAGTTANCNTLPQNQQGSDRFCDSPAERGTVMSYCHNIFYSGQLRASRYLMGKTGEASEKMLAYFRTGLEAGSPNPTITSETAPVACSAGRTASVAACTGCSYAWQITGGLITSATNANAITYTPSGANVTLTVTVTNAKGCGITAAKTFAASCGGAISPPTGVVATAASVTSVNVSWNAVGGATSYQVFRRSAGGTFAQIGTSPTNNYADNSAVANTAYLYMVRAFNGVASTDSNSDLATTVVFTDVSLASVGVKATHMIEATTAVNAVRALAGLTPVTLAPAPALGTSVSKAHVDALRTGLSAARTALSLTAVSFTDPTITAGSTSIKAVHMTDLRGGVQ